MTDSAGTPRLAPAMIERLLATPVRDPSTPVVLFTAGNNASYPMPSREEQARISARMRPHMQTIPVGPSFFAR